MGAHRTCTAKVTVRSCYGPPNYRSFMKSCAVCKQPSGKQSYCKTHRAEYERSHYLLSDSRRASIKAVRQAKKASNKAFVDRYKRMCKCSHCSESDPVVLDLHHTDPTQKDHSPNELLTCSREKLKTEMRKCIVLCSNCHRREHHRLRQG